MSRPSSRARRFTGWHMTAILVGFFGAVIAVNFTMAAFALGGFSGTVVDNSYVASQNFNRWLSEARRSEALGYAVELARDGEGRLIATTSGVPAGAVMQVRLSRPLGEREVHSLQMVAAGDGSFASAAPVPAGRWIALITIFADETVWSGERRLG